MGTLRLGTALVVAQVSQPVPKKRPQPHNQDAASSSKQAPRSLAVQVPQPKIDKKESLMQQTRKALLGEPQITNEKHNDVVDHGGREPRTVVRVKGVHRPIRL